MRRGRPGAAAQNCWRSLVTDAVFLVPSILLLPG